MSVSMMTFSGALDACVGFCVCAWTWGTTTIVNNVARIERRTLPPKKAIWATLTWLQDFCAARRTQRVYRMAGNGTSRLREIPFLDEPSQRLLCARGAEILGIRGGE